MSMASLQIRLDFAMKIVYVEFKAKILIQTFMDFKTVDQGLLPFGR